MEIDTKRREARVAAVLEEIRRIARAELNVAAPVALDTELERGLELDSMTQLVLAVGLEDRFRIKLDESAAELRTVSDLVAMVVARMEARSC
jgi:acyl carrier protein